MPNSVIVRYERLGTERTTSFGTEGEALIFIDGLRSRGKTHKFLWVEQE